MAEVKPLNALHYDLAAVSSLGDVTAPPYDVIDEAQRAELLARSPFNVVEIDLPRAPEGDDPYEHAAETLEAWTLDGVLTADREPAIWALTQEYSTPDGRRQTRHGFLVRVRVTDYGPGLVRPHERTQPGPKEDRLRLTRATRHNLSPIFALHPGNVWSDIEPHAGGDPWGEVTDSEGTIHRVWRVAEPSVHEAVAAGLADAELLIADGHHRYETARIYADEIGGDGPHRYTLMCLVSLDDPGLTIFGTHRMLTGFDAERLGRGIWGGLEGEEGGAGNWGELGSGGGRYRGAGSRRCRGRRGLRAHRPRPAPAPAAPRPGCAGPCAPGPIRGLPSPRRGHPRGAGPEGCARDEQRGHRGQARARVREGARRGAAAGRLRRVRLRVHPEADTRVAGSRGRRRRGDHAAEVDVLLPEAPHGPGLQPAELSRGRPGRDPSRSARVPAT